MAKLGIVIGVSENKAPLQSLAACKNDGSAIAEVLRQTSRFDELLVLIESGETTSTVVKDQISAFVGRHKSSDVEEVVFYFSGHGDFVGDEFYHILSDYDPSARNRTSLANTELDAMIRGLSPKLFVKIVDACHSGTSYIKSSEGLREFLKGGQAGFTDVYFLYSSQSDQVSWTSGNLSAFTECLLSEIGRRDSGATRYRDLMSAASDYFESTNQTPQFVTQSDYTQIFCEGSPAMQAVVARYLPALSLAEAAADARDQGGKNISLIERIQRVDETLCTKDEAEAAIDNILAAISHTPVPGQLSEIFEMNRHVGPKSGSVQAIGEWASKHHDSGYFVEPTYTMRTYTRTVPKDYNPLMGSLSLSSRFMGMGRDIETKEIEERRRVIEDYRSTCDIQNEQVTVRLEPKFRSVTPFSCTIIIISSLSHLRLFWSFRQYKRRDWSGNNIIQTSSKWESDEAAIKKTDQIKALAHKVVRDFYSSVESSIQAEWMDLTLEPGIDLKKKTKTRSQDEISGAEPTKS
ncbi:caspase family protein [Mycoplana dimorpha]|uniref:Caspase domain-containing protein n=1 Tax=Mycoplana dimorpha TaxID=28320 RepID=A0A2T5BC44_MYCDI|nr:caspase family protein [Mycoplana dimorpha]PTM96483.1 caspase domain-containing protein [Mycoplana dimorpha]